MGIKRLMAAASDWRTLAVLGGAIALSAVLSNPFPAIIGLGVYLWLVQRLASSPQFEQVAEQIATAKRIGERYQTMEQIVKELGRELPPAMVKGWEARVREVLNAARSLYKEWQAHPAEQGNKASVVDEALQLATHYLRILRAYYKLYVAPRPTDLTSVRERLARNQQRLAATTDLDARRTLSEAIEMDQRVLQQEQNQEVERERYLAKLANIESTMDLLRRQVFDPTVTEEGQKLHNLLLEAEAMDQALQEVQRTARIHSR